MLYNIAVCLFVFSRADPDLFQSGFNKMYLLFLFCFLFYFVMLVLLLVLDADIGCIGNWGQGSTRGCNIFVLCVAKSLCPERQCKKSLFIYFYLFNRLLILVCVCVCACFWTPFFLCVFFFLLLLFAAGTWHRPSFFILFICYLLQYIFCAFYFFIFRLADLLFLPFFHSAHFLFATIYGLVFASQEADFAFLWDRKKSNTTKKHACGFSEAFMLRTIEPMETTLATIHAANT